MVGAKKSKKEKNWVGRGGLKAPVPEQTAGEPHHPTNTYHMLSSLPSPYPCISPNFPVLQVGKLTAREVKITPENTELEMTQM